MIEEGLSRDAKEISMPFQPCSDHHLNMNIGCHFQRHTSDAYCADHISHGRPSTKLCTYLTTPTTMNQSQVEYIHAPRANEFLSGNQAIQALS